MRYLKSGKLITRCERYAFEEDEKGSVEKGPEDYLKTLQNMIFKSKKLNPSGLKAEDNSEINLQVEPTLYVYSNIGVWEDDYDPRRWLSSASKEEFNKIVGAFCKINKCHVRQQVVDSNYKHEFVSFTLDRWPNQKKEKPAPKPAQTTPRNAYDNPDSEWEDPNFQDRRKRASYYSWK